MDALAWLLNYVAAEAINIRYSHEGRWHWVRGSDFQKWNCGGCPPHATARSINHTTLYKLHNKYL